MKKKLIEVALPLDDINRAAAKEKSIRHGHPSTLHLWWARRPLAACRAVLFASLVDDPSSAPTLTETEAEAERERLFELIRQLVPWENATNEAILTKARAEIRRCCGDDPPPVLDPFCGGGSIPLEAQRLGLAAHASDLNPVAVLITKALIEIPPKFAGRPPVNPGARGGTGGGAASRGAAGLAADVRSYGAWMRREAERRIGHLYPKARLPHGGEATVIAWLWARTVTCPNPACGAEMPLVASFWLSKKPGKKTWVEPIPVPGERRVRFEIRTGNGQAQPETVTRKGGRCVVCGASVPFAHIRAEGQAGRMSQQLMAIVAEGQRGRIYLPPDAEQEAAAASAQPEWRPEAALPRNPRDFKTPNYGLTTFADLFTPRQLVALTTFSDLVGAARARVLADAAAAGLSPDPTPLAAGGTGATAYADAVATYLGMISSKATIFLSAMARWRPGDDKSAPAFGRQAIPMVWDFADVNPFAGAGGDFTGIVDGSAKVISTLPADPAGYSNIGDAKLLSIDPRAKIVATDPPYYDNI